MSANTQTGDQKVIICPVCGYRNDPANWRCQGRVTVRGDKRVDCRKDLTDKQPTADPEDFELHGPGGGR